jgi:hypothetical protein
MLQKVVKLHIEELHNYGNQIKESYVRGTCSMHAREKKFIQNISHKPEKCPVDDTVPDDKMILNESQRKRFWLSCVYLTDSICGSMVRYCKDKVPLGYTQAEEFV